MKKTISAAVIACFCAVSFTSFTAPAMADSVVIKVNPNHSRVVVKPRPVVKRVAVRRTHCYNKTVKRIYNHKTVITRQRVCN